MKEFVETLVKVLVDKPEEVEIMEKVGESTIICELRVGKGDIGKIIGKNGKQNFRAEQITKNYFPDFNMKRERF